ncbi:MULTISPECIES: nuclear transport factor 2 family protein [Streptomyces]|uniref:nuclear transport factor 2 family protein n=1 Tax=Streptomyces TaxID=1883 RepID=UPI000EB0B1E1|nr:MULTISPECIES: nuclear transport factor 2 family protein [Streptomyces]MCX4432738.1 nuclear transport factor 2 family protein [Streptomyces mirabilis]
MSWKRGLLAALAVCALLGASAGCGTGAAHERRDAVSPSLVGKILDDTDKEGRHYREVDKKSAPEVAIEVQPASDDGWDVRLTVHRFRFSPAAAKAEAVAGRGVALLSLDGRNLATLRTAEYHLAGGLVPRGTHHVTARLYADDRTAWAVHGKPVESTADITASGTAASTRPSTPVSPPPSSPSAPASTPTSTVSGNGVAGRTDTGGSPDPGGKAS